MPVLEDIKIQLRSGVVEFPVHHMRGGTSTGLVIAEHLAPKELALREELLRHLMGLPLDDERKGNRQITGLGRGTAMSNKVFFVATEEVEGTTRIVSTLAQLAADIAAVDWSVNCGNFSSALLLWAHDVGIVKSSKEGVLDIDIRNTNTGIHTSARMSMSEDGSYTAAEIPGVDGAFPSVDLFLHDPVGNKTGHLLPTGKASDEIAGHTVSCVDVAVPMVICEAAEFGKTGDEPIAELAGDAAFMSKLREIWVEAGLKMRLKRRDGSLMTSDDLYHSETIPKICIVSRSPTASIRVRYFTPQTGHASMAVSGGCCLAAATLLPGTVAHRLARGVQPLTSDYSETLVGIENPAGILEAMLVARKDAEAVQVRSAAYRRSAQVLLQGHVPLYRASPSLQEALIEIMKS